MAAEGHEAAGTCQIENDLAPTAIRNMIARVNSVESTRELELMYE